MSTVSLEQLSNWQALFDEQVIEQRSYLTELDSEIGDGDHGANMARGLAAVSAKMDAQPSEYVDDLFRLIGMTLVSSVGGASGPLYGTFFLRFGAAAGHVTELDAAAFHAALQAGADGVVERGKAELGDKTMFDSLSPAVDAFGAAVQSGATLAAAARAASDAAQAGREATANLVARKGRASYLGERAIGHIDPGAASTALLFQALADALA